MASYGKNLSKRPCDLLQKDGPKKAMQKIFFKHWDSLSDILYRMGLLRNDGECIFCEKRFATMFLQGPRKHFLQLLNHHTFHKCDHIQKHPIDRFLHMITGLVSIHLSKGNHIDYHIIKNALRHNPEQMITVIEKDIMTEEPNDRTQPYSLETFCIRALAKEYLKDLIFELGAYRTFYIMYRTHKISTRQRPYWRAKKSWLEVTNSPILPGPNGRPL